MEKIAAVFPRTFALLGRDREAIVRAVRRRPARPLDISRIENARQFHDFLTARWQHESPVPPYLPDVAGVRVSMRAGARRGRQQIGSRADHCAGAPRAWHPPQTGRRRCCAPLRYPADFRRAATERTTPIERDVPLAIAHPDCGQPQIFELTPEVFDLLAALDDWTDPAADESPEPGELIADLAEAGLLEVRR